MSLETGRSDHEQELFEAEVIRGLESAYSATRDWSKQPQASIDYRTKFIDALIRIQVGDIHSIRMLFEIDTFGDDIVRLKLRSLLL